MPGGVGGREPQGSPLSRFWGPGKRVPYQCLIQRAELFITTFWTFPGEFSPLLWHGRWRPRMTVISNNDVGERLSIRDVSRRFHSMPSAASAS